MKQDIQILDAQYLLMMVNQLVGGNPLCYSFLVKGVVSPTKLENSIRAIIAAHPALRTVFCLKNGKMTWGDLEAIYTEEKQNLLIYKDIEHFSFSRKQECFEKEYFELLNRKTAFYHWPLFVFKLYKCAKDEYQFFMGIDHSISDGLSSLLLLHQIFEHYSTNQSPTPYSSLDYNTVVKTINSYAPSHEESEAFSSFLAEIKKEKFFWNPDRRKLDYLIPEFQTLSRSINKTDLERLIRHTEHFRVSLYTLIVAVYLEVYFESFPEHQKIVFTLPTSGKVYPDVDASSLIGCFAQALTIPFEKNLMKVTLNERLQMIHQKIQHALELGFDKIQIQKLANSIRKDYSLIDEKLSEFSKWLFRSSIKSNVYLSFTGYSPIKKRYGDMEITNYQEGSINNSGTCDLMHTIFDQELYLFGNFDGKFFSLATIERLLDQVKDKLIQIARMPFAKCTYIQSHSFKEDSVNYLIQVFFVITGTKMEKDQLYDDLEGQLGLDSLGKIRLIAHLNKDFHHRIDKKALFSCRTLAEFLAHVPERNNEKKPSF